MGRCHRALSIVVVATGLACAAVVPIASGADGVLTCDQFSSRLGSVIKDMGDRVAQPGALRKAYDGDGGQRFDWDGIVGLSGTINCSKSGAFQDFGIAVADAMRLSEDLPLVLQRFMELGSASICTLAEATPDACRTLVKTMTQGSLAQFRAALSNGETMPTGTRDFFIVPGVDAELDMTPVGITWSIGPGLSMTTLAARQKLEPKDVDR